MNGTPATKLEETIKSARILSYTYNGTDSPIPHTMLEVTTVSGDTRRFGLGPVEEAPAHQGVIFDDKTHPVTSSTEFMELSASEAAWLKDYINNAIAEPPYYSIPGGSQCAVWAINGLLGAKTGMTLPTGDALYDLETGAMGPSALLGVLTTTLINPYSIESITLAGQSEAETMNIWGLGSNQLMGILVDIANSAGQTEQTAMDAWTTGTQHAFGLASGMLSTYGMLYLENEVMQLSDFSPNSNSYNPSAAGWFYDWSSDNLVSNTSSYTFSTGYTYDYDDFLPLDPIGAFYESTTPANDPALSIADKTSVFLDGAGQGLNATQVATLDANQDGKLGGSELGSLTAWADRNENGQRDAGEVAGLVQAGINEVLAGDYGFYTRGNSRLDAVAQVPVRRDEYADQPSPLAMAGIAPPALTESVPASNYRTLRDTDNRYYITIVSWIDWAPSQVKINSSNWSCLIGTDGADSFDAGYYAQYDPMYFNTSLLVNFLGGDGNDTVGGSSRDDRIWGGIGDDTLLGYAGADRLYGEEGNDAMTGGDGK